MVKQNKTLQYLAQEHREIDRAMTRLEQALHNLRFEGKGSLGRNLRQIQEQMLFFNTNLVRHMLLEDEIIFPYLQRSIPRLEPAISVLRSEHDSLKRHLAVISQNLKKLARRRFDLMTERTLVVLRDTGFYFIYLLRSHTCEETESTYRAMGRELKPFEKEELARQMQAFECSCVV